MTRAGTAEPDADESVRRNEEQRLAERLDALARRTTLDRDGLLDLLAAELTKGPLASTDVATLSVAESGELRAAGVDLSGPPPGVDPQVSAVGALARMLADALDTDAAGAVLGVGAGRVRQRLGRNLYGVRVGSSWRLPRWQFVEDGVLPGLDRVLPVLPDDVHPLAVEHFMTTPSVDLQVGDVDVSPTEWLAAGGKPEAVARLAEHLPAAP